MVCIQPPEEKDLAEDSFLRVSSHWMTLKRNRNTWSVSIDSFPFNGLVYEACVIALTKPMSYRLYGVLIETEELG